MLLAIGRDQWFIYDDWAVLHPDPAPATWLESHEGHWNTAAMLAFQALRATVGLHSYLPYLALALIAHLAVVHLIWRVMNRAGGHAWLATGLAASLIAFGSAAENVLWAFQFGFMGALALGLLTVVLVDTPRPGTARIAATVAASLAAVMFSGTALPLLAAAFVLAVVRRGLWRPVLVFLPVGIVYVAWYVLFASGSTSQLAPHGIDIVTRAPVFFAAMFAAGYGQFVGVVPLGVVIALVLAFWVIRRFPIWRGRAAPAFAVLLASVVFAVLTAASRGGGELTAAGAQRYVYVIVALAVPVIGLALGELLTRGRAVRASVAGLIAVVAVVNGALLVIRADEQAMIEQRTEREVSAALEVLADDSRIPGGALAIPDRAPDLTAADLRAADRQGLITRVAYSRADLTTVREALRR